ncbi:MAG: hypothetical protein P8Q28_04960 [Luminiphilus sp.]|nr:hypothetical protein [Luminiphilus sp.]
MPTYSGTTLLAKFTMRHLLHIGLVVVFAASVSATAEPSKTTEQSRSVVRLDVPLQRNEQGRRRHFVERCSAFLISNTKQRALLASAWHCIDGIMTFAKAPTLHLIDGPVAVETINSGGSMAKDWLLIGAPREALAHLKPISTSRRPIELGEVLVAIGFGGETALGDRYSREVACPVSEVGVLFTLQCALQKGDSGGLIARRQLNGQLEAVGIISSGDSQGVSIGFALQALPTIPPY